MSFTEIVVCKECRNVFLKRESEDRCPFCIGEGKPLLEILGVAVAAEAFKGEGPQGPGKRALGSKAVLEQRPPKAPQKAKKNKKGGETSEAQKDSDRSNNDSRD